MLRLNDSVGVICFECLPDDPDDLANPGGGLVNMSILVLMFEPLKLM